VAILLLVIAIAIVGSFLLNVTAQASTVGREIQELQITISAMEIENAGLQGDLAQMTSYEVMSDRADRLGYELTEIDYTIFTTVEGYGGASSPRLATKDRQAFEMIETELPPEYTETIFTWLKKQILEQTVPIPEMVP
jgi:hypothetical protein